MFGYKETLFRDLPFSALQFSFYETFRQWAIYSNNGSDDLSISMELLTGAAAGGLAGTLTTPPRCDKDPYSNSYKHFRVE